MMKNYIKKTNKELKSGIHFKKIYKNNKHVMGGKEQKNFSAAGIIPYDIKKNQVYLMLNTYNIGPSKGIWSYFGGKKEESDQISIKNALREAYEESYDIKKKEKHLPIGINLYDNEDINNALLRGNFYIIPKLNESNNSWNNIYFIKIDKNRWKDYDFNNISSYVLNKEIGNIKWFSLNEIFDLIKKGKLTRFIASVLSKYYDNINNFI